MRASSAGRLELRRDLPAAPAAVWAAFVDPIVLAKWWGPAGFSIPSLEYRPEVGESYRIEMQPPTGDAFYLAGVFREVDPPVRLVYTFEWEDPDPDDLETLVELSFSDLGAATRVVMDQAVFKTEARRQLHRDGWTESFDKLEALLL
jgi:uncharacterized protein YndB with AHSA1/START domain